MTDSLIAASAPTTIANKNAATMWPPINIAQSADLGIEGTSFFTVAACGTEGGETVDELRVFARSISFAMLSARKGCASRKFRSDELKSQEAHR
jgi:hypothetical protein